MTGTVWAVGQDVRGKAANVRDRDGTIIMWFREMNRYALCGAVDVWQLAEALFKTYQVTAIWNSKRYTEA